MSDQVKQLHGIESAFYDNLGDGWRLECICGFMTDPSDSLQIAGSDMDDHFSDPEEGK